MKKTRQIDIELGKSIISQRLACGFSRKDLAEAIGLTHQQLQKYEKGINRISVARLYDIAAVLKVPVTEFLKSEDNEYDSISALESRSAVDIIRHINKITDETKLLAIKNLIKSMAVTSA